MKYDWEDRAKSLFIDVINSVLDDWDLYPFEVLAVAVANVDDGRAALIRVDGDYDVPLDEVDFFSDIAADAKSAFGAAFYAARLDYIKMGVSEFRHTARRTREAKPIHGDGT